MKKLVLSTLLVVAVLVLLSALWIFFHLGLGSVLRCQNNYYAINDGEPGLSDAGITYVDTSNHTTNCGAYVDPETMKKVEEVCKPVETEAGKCDKVIDRIPFWPALSQIGFLRTVDQLFHPAR